jgi:transposase-like protein
MESLNARIRAATRRRRGHFPDEEATLRVLYLTIRERRPNRANPTGQIAGWKNILKVLAMTYSDRPGSNQAEPITKEVDRPRGHGRGRGSHSG